VDFLANHSVKPGSREAQAMTVTSGLKCSALLKKQDPVGCLVKTLLESSTWHSTMCFLNWKAKGTPQGRLYFQLAPSTPRTDETESGSLPTYGAKPGQRIPTPTASDHIERKSTSKEKLNYQTNKSVTLDRFVKMWPTPASRDYKDTGVLRAKVRKDGKNRVDTLGRVVGVEVEHLENPGSLNPMFVEWLMGFPSGWTDLKPSETP
jgi:hypothetical protein